MENTWLISHAGFHPSWLVGTTPAEIPTTGASALRRAARGVFNPLLGMGANRFGLQSVGGPLWMDWSSLVPVPGINQIVGHTPGGAVREKITPESKNYCLDVRNGEAAAIIDDQGEIKVLT